MDDLHSKKAHSPHIFRVPTASEDLDQMAHVPLSASSSSSGEFIPKSLEENNLRKRKSWAGEQSDERGKRSVTPLRLSGSQIQPSNWRPQRASTALLQPNILFVVALLVRLWISLHSCEQHARPSALHLYPSLFLSCVSIIMAGNRAATSWQYFVAAVQWIWTMLALGANNMCEVGNDVAGSRSLAIPMAENTALLAFTVFLIYVSKRFGQ
eukprot:TRINITY_DN5539_c0_g1_i2.p1 TRINITY_DN5539_c0_g1~~TRINITY_DN5539_c0_g1_i2.p1  ORF type:complete len:211 (+),score=42.92 TRINITY_DN5539_c0_g1_i2:183-815(+)